ncbi:ribonuclease H-like domain-containing protein [Podospora appendiculata]|uniref:Ribonuclease H n=1 Tax=Podospora appendiculata TaxID=314037 RepID=A0AAE0X1P5_9PEZI|nr:ribonuclease H-like domain-containing protein [Podospora appendiculata]
MCVLLALPLHPPHLLLLTRRSSSTDKGFTSYAEAYDYVRGIEGDSGKFYAVAVGRVPGIYNNWSEAEKQIKGWTGPKFKKFDTRQEAEAFIREKRLRDPVEKLQFESEVDSDEADSDSDEVFEVEPPTKKARISKTAAATTTTARAGPSAAAAPSMVGAGDVMVVYTDGSSRGNGKVGARAGLGVYFGRGNKRNISERLAGPIQTNQRAELAAILRTLETIDTDTGVEIRTDSKYSIDCVTKWYKSWVKNEWQTTSKKDVENQDIIRPIRDLIDARDMLGTVTRFVWVKGHGTDEGNIAADNLAVAGALKPPAMI